MVSLPNPSAPLCPCGARGCTFLRFHTALLIRAGDRFRIELPGRKRKR